jgi:hypothetical protein
MQQSGFGDGKPHYVINNAINELTPDDISTYQAASSGYMENIEIGSSGISSVSIGLAITSKSELRVSVNLSSGVQMISTDCTTSTSGNATSYIFSVKNISPENLGENKVFTIQTSQGTATITAPALSYVRSILNNSGTSEALKIAMVAYYRYYLSVMNYVGNT